MADVKIIANTMSECSVDICETQSEENLVEAVKCDDEDKINELINHFERNPKNAQGKKMIDLCIEGMNAVHVAVMENKLETLVKLADAGADLEKCTEDEMQSPPIVLAARYSPKVVYKEYITEEATLMRKDNTKAKAKGGFKTDDVQANRVLRESTQDERIKEITAHTRKKIKTTYHILLQHKVNVNDHNVAGVTALHIACDRGIIAMVEDLLQCDNIEVNIKDVQQNTPLHSACRGSETDIVFKLIDKGADVFAVNIEGMNPFHVAVVQQRLEIVEMMLDMRDKFDDNEDLMETTEKDENSPLLLAVKTGDEEMVKVFVDNKADVKAKNHNGVTALHLASSLKRAKILRLIYYANRGDGMELLNECDNKNRTPLHYAAKRNQIEALDFLLDENAEEEKKDYREMTPLLLAATYGNTEAVMKLYDRGVDMKAVDYTGSSIIHLIVNQGNLIMLKAIMKTDAGHGLCEVQSENGNTPLHSSCEKGYLEIVKIFLDSGVAIDRHTNVNDQTPLHLACAKGHYIIVEELLNKGAKTWSRDDCRNTPLLCAVANGHLETTKLLVDNGAEVDVINAKVGTPLTCAAKNGYEEIVKCLLENAADVNGKFGYDDIQTTPLIAASQNNHVRVVKHLLAYNANVTIEHSDSQLNCLGEAIIRGHSDVAMAIVQSEHWKDAMRLCVEHDEYGDITPMKLLIKLMPDVAKAVLDRCITEKSKGVPSFHWDYCETYNYEYLEGYKDEDCKDEDCKDEDGNADHDSAAFVIDLYEEKPNHGKPSAENTNTTKQKGKGKNMMHIIWGPKDFKKEEHPLQVMVESQRKELLKHRIVTRLLENKWRSFGKYFYFCNLSTYFVYLLCLTVFALLSPTPNSPECLSKQRCSLLNNEICVEDLFPNDPISENDVRNINGKDYVLCLVNFTRTTVNEDNAITTSETEIHCFGIMISADSEDDSCTEDDIHYFLRIVAIMGVISSIIRLLIEGIQLILKRINYFFDWENWLETSLFIAAIIFLLYGLQSKCVCPESWQWQLGAVILLLSWLNLVLFLKKLPLTGIYVLMFVDIFNTFMKMILLSILFIISFGLAFYMLFFRPGNHSSFSSPGRSLVKTMVMTTGEFEFDGIFFNSQQDAEEDRNLYYPHMSYTLWVAFIVLVPIILTNLLVGLAVDDIKGVQETAAMKRLALQVALELDVEDIMIPRIRKRYRKKTEDVYPNRNDSWWYKLSSHFMSAPKDNKKSIIDNLPSSMPPIERLQAETTRHTEELYKLNMMICDLVKKQNYILQYVMPKKSNSAPKAVRGKYKVINSGGITSSSSDSSSDTGDDD